METIKVFNQYSLYAILILLALPFIYPLLPKLFNSYFDAFDKLSIPLWSALYSLFWLKFSWQIKKKEPKILIYKDRITSLEKIGIGKYFNEYKTDTARLSNLKDEIVGLKLHFDFVNEALRISVIASAILKVLQLLVSLSN